MPVIRLERMLPMMGKVPSRKVARMRKRKCGKPITARKIAVRTTSAMNAVVSPVGPGMFFVPATLAVSLMARITAEAATAPTTS